MIKIKFMTSKLISWLFNCLIDSLIWLVSNFIGIVLFLIIFICLIIVVTCLNILDKSLLDSFLVIVSLMGLILNNIIQDYPQINEFLKKATYALIKFISIIILFISPLLLASSFLHILDQNGFYNFLLSIIVLLIGSIFYHYSDKVKDKNIIFSLYFAIILLVYIFFCFKDVNTFQMIQKLYKTILSEIHNFLALLYQRTL